MKLRYRFNNIISDNDIQMENAENVTTIVSDPEDKIHFKNEIKQEIKSEPLSEDEAGDISKIYFDYEDNIPIKK